VCILHRRAVGGGGEGDAVAACRLGLGQSRGGAVEQGRAGFEAIPLRHPHRAGERVQHFTRQPLQAHHRAVLLGIGQEECKFRPGIAGKEIFRPHRLVQLPRGAAQIGIARGMAETFIEGLELVDIEHGEAERPAVPPRGRGSGEERLVQSAAIIEPGDVIGARGMFEQMQH